MKLLSRKFIRPEISRGLRQDLVRRKLDGAVEAEEGRIIVAEGLGLEDQGIEPVLVAKDVAPALERFTRLGDVTGR